MLCFGPGAFSARLPAAALRMTFSFNARRNCWSVYRQTGPCRKDHVASAFRRKPRDERHKSCELLLDEAARRFVGDCPGLLVEFGRAVGDEDLGLVERERVEKDHGFAKLVLHARAPDRPGRSRL